MLLRLSAAAWKGKQGGLLQCIKLIKVDIARQIGAPAKECIAVFDSPTLSLGLAGSKGPPCVLFSGEASCYGFVHNSLQKDLGRMRV